MAFVTDTTVDIGGAMSRLLNTCGELPGRCFRNAQRENAEDGEAQALGSYLLAGAVVVVAAAYTGYIPEPVVEVVKTVINPVINAGRQVLGWVCSWF